MENTLENKKRFFAQYETQEIAKSSKSSIPHIVSAYFVMPHHYLELKHISSITDEDMSNMANFYEKSATNIYIHDFQLTFDYYHGDETHSAAVELNQGYCLDFLRCNGYAIDWMGLSVDKLQEYGWIKLVN